MNSQFFIFFTAASVFLSSFFFMGAGDEAIEPALSDFDAWTKRALCGGVPYHEGVFVVQYLYADVEAVDGAAARYISQAFLDYGHDSECMRGLNGSPLAAPMRIAALRFSATRNPHFRDAAINYAKQYIGKGGAILAWEVMGLIGALGGRDELNFLMHIEDGTLDAEWEENRMMAVDMLRLRVR